MKSPPHRKILQLDVLRTEQVSPSFIRLTLGGDALAEFEPMGFDQFVRLFFLREGQRELCLPTLSNNAWYAQYLLMPKHRRPWCRNYTIRAVRTRPTPDSPDERPIELDIEFAVHGDSSPASSWVQQVKAGDPVGILPEGIGYLPPADAEWQLFVGDESAMPAILAILEQAPASLSAEIYLEVPTPDDIGQVSAPADVNIHWLPRCHAHAIPGQLALEAVTRAELPPGRFYTWIAGESALPEELRKHLIRGRAVAKSDISFVAYWRHGQASPG